MIRYFVIFLVGIALSKLAYGQPVEGDEAAPEFSAVGFEDISDPELFEFWTATPEDTVRIDRSRSNSGQASIEIVRTDESERDFTSLTFRINSKQSGSILTLRAALKVEEIREHASLWMRQDDDFGSVAFINMQGDSLQKPQDWMLSEISFPVAPSAKYIFGGVVLSGAGRMWADDFQILLDGEPVEIMPKIDVEKPASPFLQDTEFQESSGVTLTHLDSNAAQNVSALIKVWGFLKYHHPTVTGGAKHWDFEFFRILPAVMKVKNHHERNEILSHWVQELGSISECDPCATYNEEAPLKSNLSWIWDEQYLGAALSRQLIQVLQNRGTEASQFFVKPGQVGQAEFRNELPYSDLETLDAGYRMLAVARYWNIIEYWFPYRDLVNTDWDAVLSTYLVQAVESDNDLKYQLTMARIIAEVGDSHAKLYSHLSVLPPMGDCHLPVEVRFIEGKPTITRFRHDELGPQTGARIGDVVSKIDGMSVADQIEQMRPFYAASNISVQNRDIAQNLLRGECGPLSLEVSRSGDKVELGTERKLASKVDGWRENLLVDRAGETVQILDEDIGYLKLSSVRTEDVPSYVEAFRGKKGLVIDIRNYPSAFMPFALGQWIVKTDAKFAKFTLPDFNSPGAFNWSESEVVISPIKTGERLSLPVAVLVNEVSQSQSEYTAMAFRALPNTIIVGSQTAGADGNIARIVLPGNLRTVISGIGVFYPDGTPTQRIGIVPDVEVHPTRFGIMSGRDEVLERAIVELKKLTQETSR